MRLNKISASVAVEFWVNRDKGATSRFVHFEMFSLIFSSSSLVCNQYQSSPSLTILVPLCNTSNTRESIASGYPKKALRSRVHRSN